MCHPLTFDDLALANRVRQAEWPNSHKIDGLYRAVELGGENGELLNVVKKLERERLGIPGSRATEDQLKKELGDVVICASLLAIHYGVDLATCVAYAFNLTSEQIGLTTRIER